MDSSTSVRFLNSTTPPHIFTLIVLSGLSAMVMNIFLPSLPEMAHYFDTPYAVVQLSVPLFLLSSAIMQLFIGPISDNLGRRRVMLWGMGLFVLATVGCMLSPNITVFLGFRIAQAVCACAMVLSRAIIRDLYSAEQSASIMGYVTMGMAVSPMISPAIGGMIEQYFDWHFTFAFTALIGLAILLLVYFDLGESSGPSGISLMQQFKQYPELLRSPRFWGYAGASAFSSGAFFAYLGGAPFVGSSVFNLSPFWLGIYFGAPAIGYFLGNFLTGYYATRFGINALVLIGCAICLLATALMLGAFFAGMGSAESFFGLMSLIGLGNGLCVPNANAGMLSVRPHLAGTASGLGGSIMIGGGAGLAVLAGLLLTPESGAYPLLWLMAFTSLGGLLSILGVIRREKTLGITPN